MNVQRVSSYCSCFERICRTVSFRKHNCRTLNIRGYKWIIHCPLIDRKSNPFTYWLTIPTPDTHSNPLTCIRLNLSALSACGTDQFCQNAFVLFHQNTFVLFRQYSAVGTFKVISWAWTIFWTGFLVVRLNTSLDAEQPTKLILFFVLGISFPRS